MRLVRTAEMLRTKRNKKHISQNDVAKKLDTSVQFISNFENSRCNLPLKKLQAFGKLVGVKPDELKMAMVEDYYFYVGKVIK